MGAEAKEHDFTINKAKDEQEDRKELAKREKEDKEREPQKAVSPFTGGDIRIGKLSGKGSGSVATTVSSTYVGVGPLIVPSTRGEQKAQSGDVAIEFYLDAEEPENDKYYVIVMPAELADALGISTQGDGISQQDWNKFYEDRAKRQTKGYRESRERAEDRQDFERAREIQMDRASSPQVFLIANQQGVADSTLSDSADSDDSESVRLKDSEASKLSKPSDSARPATSSTSATKNQSAHKTS